jgi:excisionase family DNA binding protein
MKVYSVAEAAAELGISRNLVYMLCQCRRIRHERHGLGKGKIVIPADALEEYRQRVTVPPEGQEALSPPGAAAGHQTLRSVARCTCSRRWSRRCLSFW